MINIPTILTLIRILAVPLLVLIYYLPFHYAHLIAAILFALAALTDWLDGYLARNLAQTTRFGAFLDPVADKLIVAVALVMVVGEVGRAYLTIPAAVIVGREIIISALREWMAEIGKRTSIAVTMVAKFKTVIQMVALILLLVYQKGQTTLVVFGCVLIYVAAALTLWSMMMYLRAAWYDLTLREEKQ